MIRTVLSASLLLGLAACAQNQSPLTLSDKQLVASCQQQQAQAFREQNRALLSEQSQIYTPFSSSGTRGVTTTGLGDQYASNLQLQDCLRQQGAPNGVTNTQLNTGPASAGSPGGLGNAARQSP